MTHSVARYNQQRSDKTCWPGVDLQDGRSHASTPDSIDVDEEHGARKSLMEHCKPD